MGKQKTFAKGKYVQTRTVHIKAVHGKGGPHLDVTIRFPEDIVRKYLLPQVSKFLGALEKQADRKRRRERTA